MLVLKPYPHITIWGGERLSKYIDEDIKGIGHLYTVRATKKDSNIILNGPARGENLYHYFLKNRKHWGLERFEEFPISIALVDAKESLSVQVHPDEEIAAKYETKVIGKNEAFYLLEEPEEKQMINGCKCRTKEELRYLVEKECWEDIIDYLPVKKGDYVYVSAGTMHAMTKGGLTYEIEENCEYTYRLFDYNRIDKYGNERKLDVDKAIESILVSQKSYVQKYGKNEIVEKRFATCLLRSESEYENTSENIVCVTIISGEGEIEGVKIKPGMSIICEPGEIIREATIDEAIAARILQ